MGNIPIIAIDESLFIIKKISLALGLISSVFHNLCSVLFATTT